ncbi:AAA family ATPase [Magnetovibrio sp. PR-2]|uniref:AAA family ATPase n=1 Tax=Magnetovibrio sp. PR-2 TaxID=3120356 RepID=UPI002FCE3AE8
MQEVLLTPKEIGEHFSSCLVSMPNSEASDVIRILAQSHAAGRSFVTPTRALRTELGKASKVRDDYKKIDMDNPEIVRWFYWISRAIEDGMLTFALHLMNYARHYGNDLPRVESEYISASYDEIVGIVFGTTDSRSLHSLQSTFSAISLPESSGPHFLDLMIEGLNEETYAVIREKCDTDAESDHGWPGVDPVGLEEALNGDLAQFCELADMVVRNWGTEMLARVASQVFVDHDLPAAWVILRVIWAKAIGDARIDTSTIDAYLHEVIPDNPEAAQAADVASSVAVPEGHVILAPNFGLAATSRRHAIKNYTNLGQPIELRPSKVSPEQLRQLLTNEFPWMALPIDLICRDMSLREAYGQKEFSLPPLLIWGRPGTGKTRFLQRMAKLIGLPSDMVSLAGAADDRSLRGTGAGYSSATPAYPVVKMSETACPNTVMIFDEIDKTAASGQNGDPLQTILMWTERENARGFFDDCLQTTVDMRHANFFATANQIKNLPMPLLSRFRVIETPSPEPDHVRSIINGVRADFAEEVGVDVRFVPEMDEAEIMFLEDVFAKHQNVRAVIRMSQKLLERRERLQRAQPN